MKALSRLLALCLLAMVALPLWIALPIGTSPHDGERTSGLVALAATVAITLLAGGVACFVEGRRALPRAAMLIAIVSFATGGASLAFAIAFYAVRHDAHGALEGLVFLFGLPAVLLLVVAVAAYFWATAKQQPSQHGNESAALYSRQPSAAAEFKTVSRDT